MSTKTEQSAPIEDDAPDKTLVSFGDWIARLITHEDVPDTLRNALSMMVVNTISNQSGYDWSDDLEGLRFMLPRLLFQMNEEYARAVIQTTDELVLMLLPEKLRREFQESHWLKGDASR